MWHSRLSRWIKHEKKWTKKSSTNQDIIATALKTYLNDLKKYLTTFEVVNLHIVILWRLCIKPGIQERRTECGEWGKCYISGNVAKHSRNVLKHFEECRQTFRGMSSNISGNVSKHSRECPQTYRGMSPNIPGNVAKHSGECPQTFWGMSRNITGKVPKDSGECRQTFRKMSSNIPGNVVEHFRERSQTIQRIFENSLGHVVKPSFRVSYFVISISAKNEKWNLETHTQFLASLKKRKSEILE